MSGPQKLLSVSFEHVDETESDGSQSPWRRAILGLQDAVRDIVQRLNATPYVISRSISTTFTAGQIKVLNHGLGRKPTRWVHSDVSGGYASFVRTDWDETTISIQSQNACSATFLIE